MGKRDPRVPKQIMIEYFILYVKRKSNKKKINNKIKRMVDIWTVYVGTIY